MRRIRLFDACGLYAGEHAPFLPPSFVAAFIVFSSAMSASFWMHTRTMMWERSELHLLQLFTSVNAARPQLCAGG